MTRLRSHRAVLADTSTLYALVDPSDQHHKVSLAQSKLLVQGGYHVVVTYATLQEAHALVLHRLRPRVALRWLREIRQGTDLLGVPAADYKAALHLAERYNDQNITLHDLTLSVVSKKLSVPIWTFDADFDILGAHVWRPS